MKKDKKWFRHTTDFFDSREIQYILDYCGHAGVFAYVRLLEIFASHFNPESPEIFEESRRYIFSEIFPRITHKTGKKILENLQRLKLLSYKIENKRIIFNCSFFKERKIYPQKKRGKNG